MKIMIDAAVHSSIKELINGLYLVLAVLFIAILLFMITEFFEFCFYGKSTANFQSKLFNKILHLPIQYMEKNHSGDTLSRLTNDIFTMEDAYSWPFRNAILTIIKGIGAAAVMLVLDWKVKVSF
jgi:ABC-type multidrug transport system fused ATPase/permease subunit